MDWQPVSRRHTIMAALVGTLAATSSMGCRDDELYDGAFEMPVAAAVLHPDAGGPSAAHEPVGFVANGIGGRIVLLALKQGRFLNDDDTAAFLRTNDLPTGGLRLLTSVAAYAPHPYDVQVFAGDARFEQLVMVPWVIGWETVEQRVVPVEGYASYYPPDLSGAPGIQLDNIEVKKGYTTSERWTLTFQDTGWEVVGSRSGRQPRLAYDGESFVAEERRIAFTLSGDGQNGQSITLDTWNGLEEYDVGGRPLELAMAPDQSVMAMIVHDRATDSPTLRWFDPDLKRVAGEVNLPEGSIPHRMEWSEDGSQLFVADAGYPAVWSLAPGAAGGREIAMPGPTLDVASLAGDTREALFAASGDGRTLWMFDAETGEQLDQNAMLSGVQGLPLDSPIQGLASLRQEHLLPEYDDSERRLSGRTVALTVARGSTLFVHEQTGCLVQDSLGPRTVSDGNYSQATDYEVNFDVDFGPYLEQNGSSGRHVVVNSCAGVARSDSWRVTYDQLAGGWRVRSELSGEQSTLAHEDERFLSDGGEVSFTVRAGPAASVDGMQFTFVVESGIAEASGDSDSDGDREVELAIPSDPVPFHYEVGDRDGSWYRVDDRPHVLVLGQTSDVVGRVDPQEAQVDVAWR